MLYVIGAVVIYILMFLWAAWMDEAYYPDGGPGCRKMADSKSILEYMTQHEA